MVQTSTRRLWWLWLLPILPLVLFAVAHRVMWSPPLTDNDVLLRQSLSGATEVRISFYNNHEGIIVRGQDVVNLINALRVQDETVENSDMGGGPSTDFDFHQEGRDMRWVSLKPGATVRKPRA